MDSHTAIWSTTAGCCYRLGVRQLRHTVKANYQTGAWDTISTYAPDTRFSLSKHTAATSTTVHLIARNESTSSPKVFSFHLRVDHLNFPVRIRCLTYLQLRLFSFFLRLSLHIVPDRNLQVLWPSEESAVYVNAKQFHRILNGALRD